MADCFSREVCPGTGADLTPAGIIAQWRDTWADKSAGTVPSCRRADRPANLGGGWYPADTPGLGPGLSVPAHEDWTMIVDISAAAAGQPPPRHPEERRSPQQEGCGPASWRWRVSGPRPSSALEQTGDGGDAGPYRLKFMFHSSTYLRVLLPGCLYEAGFRIRDVSISPSVSSSLEREGEERSKK